MRVILGGLNPQERLRLVFLERPRSFEDLSRACVFARTIQMNDETRSSTSEFPVSCSTSGQQRPPPREQRGNNTERKIYGCYNCGKMWHLARNCQFKRSEVSGEKRPSKNGLRGGLRVRRSLPTRGRFSVSYVPSCSVATRHPSGKPSYKPVSYTHLGSSCLCIY